MARVEPPAVGVGTAPLGGLFSHVEEDDAMATIAIALEHGVRYFDTAPLYGHGMAEMRLGRALRASGVDRAELTISTKVGRVLEPGVDTTSMFEDVPDLKPEFDFSADGVRRSLESSLERLGVDRVDIALVHDPDDHEDEAIASTFPTLQRLRDEGLIGAIGSGMNQSEMLARFAARADDLGLDCVMIAGRWSLLDRGAGAPDGLLDTCAANGVAVIAAGVFNSGLLADPDRNTTFDYEAAPSEMVDAARAMARSCEERGVALAAAALQFPRRHPAVTSVIFGARTPAEVTTNLEGLATTIPDDLWPALDDCQPNWLGRVALEGNGRKPVRRSPGRLA